MKPIDKIKAQKISHIDPEENPVKACPNVSEFEKIAKAKAMKDISLVGRGEVSTLTINAAKMENKCQALGLSPSGQGKNQIPNKTANGTR